MIKIYHKDFAGWCCEVTALSESSLIVGNHTLQRYKDNNRVMFLQEGGGFASDCRHRWFNSLQEVLDTLSLAIKGTK